MRAARPLKSLIASGLARAFAGTLFVGVVSRLLVLAMAVVLARRLSPDGYGAFTFATGLASLAAQFSGLGWSGIVSRMIPKLRVNEDWPSLRGLLRSGDVVVVCGALIAATLIAAVMVAPFTRPELRGGLAISIVLLVPTAIGLMRRNELAGVRKPAAGITFDQALPPAAVIVFVLAFGVTGVEDAIYLLAGATLLGAVLATFYLRRALPQSVWRAPPNYEVRAWMALALPLLIGQSAKMIMDRTDAVMLGPLSTFDQVGYYGAAFRLTYLMTFPQVMMMAVMTPIFSESIAQSRSRHLWRHFRIAMAFSVATALPLGGILFLLRDPILGFVFGGAFMPAAGALSYLALSQAVFAVSIPCSGLLIAAGRTKAFGVLNLVALAANVGLNFLLIPEFGAQGAALATAVSTFVIAVGLAVLLYRLRHTLADSA